MRYIRIKGEGRNSKPGDVLEIKKRATSAPGKYRLYKESRETTWLTEAQLKEHFKPLS